MKLVTFSRAGTMGAGLLLDAWGRALCRTCTVEFVGEERLPSDRSLIYAMWHEFAVLYFIVDGFRGRNLVMLNHPARYMKPIHAWLYRCGVERLELGSTGHGGREAAARVIEALKAGANTYVNPDGPYGPKREPRKGAFHMAAQSGALLAPVRFDLSAPLHLPTWDQKVIPRPGSRVTVEFMEPFAVDDPTEAKYWI